MTTNTGSEETIHARLGASKAARWRTCPGSVLFTADIPDPPPSEHALEGTKAHKLAEEVLNGTSGQYPHQTEMSASVAVFTSYCRRLKLRPGKYGVEARVDLAPLKPAEPIFGTADFWHYDPVSNVLEVVDLKYGMRKVEVQDNDQLLVYGLGAALPIVLESGEPLDRLVITIVQPRAEHPQGSIRSATYTWDEIRAFAENLLADAHATQDPEAPLVAGSHCANTYCPARGFCPARLAMVEETMGVAVTDSTPLANRVLTDEQVAAILDRAEEIKNFLTMVQTHAHDTLTTGGAIPGYKLVAGRRSRTWVDPERAEKYLRRRLGAKKTFTKKLLSPKQAENALKGDEGQLAAFVRVNPGKPRIAQEASPKPAVTETFFEVLEPPREN